MDDFDIGIRGVDELLKTFSRLPTGVRNKAIRPAMKAGMNIVKERAKANVQAVVSSEATGTLAKNITVQNLKKYRGRLRTAVRIKPKAVNRVKKDKDGKPVRVGLYGAVLEYGKSNQPPRSWLRKAAREGTSEVLETVRMEVAKNIVAAVADSKGGA